MAHEPPAGKDVEQMMDVPFKFTDRSCERHSPGMRRNYEEMHGVHAAWMVACQTSGSPYISHWLPFGVVLPLSFLSFILLFLISFFIYLSFFTQSKCTLDFSVCPRHTYAFALAQFAPQNRLASGLVTERR